MNLLSSLKRLLGADSREEEALDPEHPRSLAAELVDANPDHELDYTPRSLLALDDLASDVDVTGDRREADARGGDGIDEGGLGDAPETPADAEATNERVRRMGAYLGETFVRAYDGEWTYDERAGWVVELPATRRGEPIVLTIPSVLGDVFQDESSFATVHDVFASELDEETPGLAADDGADDAVDPREQPSPADVVAAFDRVAAELAADHDGLDFTPESLGALDAIAREREAADVEPFDPDTDDLDLSVGGHTDAVAGYFAAVLRTHHDAAYRGELAETLVVDGPTRTARLEPRTLAAAVAAGETSFEGVYADLCGDLGLGSHGHD